MSMISLLFSQNKTSLCIALIRLSTILLTRSFISGTLTVYQIFALITAYRNGTKNLDNKIITNFKSKLKQLTNKLLHIN